MSSRRFFLYLWKPIQSNIVSTVLIPYSPIFPVHRSKGTVIGFRVCNGPEHITLTSYCIVSLFYITFPLYMKTFLIYQAEFFSYLCFIAKFQPGALMCMCLSEHHPPGIR